MTTFRTAWLSLWVLIRMTIPAILICEILKRRKSQSEDNLSPKPRILVIRLDHIGDLVMSSAMIRELKRAYSDAEITLVVSSGSLRVAEPCPHVERVLAVDTEDVRIDGEFRIASVRKVLQFCRKHIEPGTFDMAIIPRWDADWYLAIVISLYSRAKKRVAFTANCSRKKSIVNWGYDRYLTDPIPKGPFQHEVERNLAILEYMNQGLKDTRTELWLTAADREFADKWWITHNVGKSGVVIAIAPGAKKAKCRWPVAEFSRLIQSLWVETKRDVTVILICSPEESHLASAIISDTEARVLFPLTSNIRQAAAIISKCSLLIGNNSGPIHLAAAAGIAVLEISCHPINGDPNDDLNPLRFGSFTKRGMVVQPATSTVPCTNRCRSTEAHCISAVKAEHVTNAVLRMMHTAAITATSLQ